MMNSTGDGSTSASTAPIAGTAKPATGSPNSDIDALLKRINDLDKSLKESVLEAKTENYFELLKAYQELYDKEINNVDNLLKKYSGYMDTSQEKRYNIVFYEFAVKANSLNSKYDLLNINNDPLSIKRIILDKQKFEDSTDMQQKAGDLIRESVLKSCKEGKISKEETKEFIASWVKISRDRPDLKQDIYRKIYELENKAKSMNLSKPGGKKGYK